MRSFSTLVPILIMALPICIGTITMSLHQISPRLWGQNLLIFSLVFLVYILGLKRKKSAILSPQWIIALSSLLLVSCFFYPGIQHVYRWMSIGPIHLYISSIVLPLLIINIGQLGYTINWWYTFLMFAGVICILFFQPDAAQTTACSMAACIYLIPRVKHISQYITLSIPIVLSVLSWYFIDGLHPVSYVEGILQMTKASGWVLYGLGILSLILLPLPFLILKKKTYRILALCLGGYFIGILLSSQLGHFPVPLLGYGISPILGYSIALFWLQKQKRLHYA